MSDSKPSEPSESERPPYSMWRGRGGIVTAIAMLVCAATGRQFWPGQQQTEDRTATVETTARLLELLEARRSANEAFWANTVADLHPIRFGNPPAGTTASDYLASHVSDLGDAIKQARAYHRQHAGESVLDQGLVEMAERHFAIDEEYMSLLKQAEKLARARDLPPDQASVSARAEEGRELMNAVEDGDLSTVEIAAKTGIPRNLAERAVELEYRREAMRTEIETLRSRLFEAFPKGQFPLQSE